jgi:hypothetical protein
MKFALNEAVPLFVCESPPARIHHTEETVVKTTELSDPDFEKTPEYGAPATRCNHCLAVSDLR